MYVYMKTLKISATLLEMIAIFIYIWYIQFKLACI